MTENQLRAFASNIVQDACALRDKHTTERSAPVHYACIFAQSAEEFDEFVAAASLMGTVHKETPTGPLYRVARFETAGGPLRLLKIRKPDPTRPERGDADFAATDYQALKRRVGEPGFKLIVRDTFEMVEIVDPVFDVRVYFSNPPVEVQHGLV